MIGLSVENVWINDQTATLECEENGVAADTSVQAYIVLSPIVLMGPSSLNPSTRESDFYS